MPSLIANGAFMYSQTCNIVNTIPKAILTSNPLETSARVSVLNMLLCEKVAVTPEDTNTIVFNNGIPNGCIGSIPIGGQTQPIQIDGEIAT